MNGLRRRSYGGRASTERGAALVEFAFMLPILLLLVVGVIEFGRAFNTQISLTGAAREGARYMAIHDDSAEASQVVIDSAGLPQAPSVAISPGSCSSGLDVTVTASQAITIGIPFFAVPPINLEGMAVMRCGG